MTLRELITLSAGHPEFLALFFAIVPALALLLPVFHKKGQGERAPFSYLYSLLTYLACIPGVFAAVLVGYSLFFTRENLLDVNLLVYFLPLLSMGLTLALIGKQVSFSALPGFDRLSGLMILLGGTFLIVLAVQKLFIGIFFGGSIVMLLAIGTAVFLLLKWAVHALFRGPREARQPRPSLFK